MILKNKNRTRETRHNQGKDEQCRVDRENQSLGAKLGKRVGSSLEWTLKAKEKPKERPLSVKKKRGQ